MEDLKSWQTNLSHKNKCKAGQSVTNNDFRVLEVDQKASDKLRILYLFINSR